MRIRYEKLERPAFASIGIGGGGTISVNLPFCVQEFRRTKILSFSPEELLWLDDTARYNRDMIDALARDMCIEKGGIKWPTRIVLKVELGASMYSAEKILRIIVGKIISAKRVWWNELTLEQAQRTTILGAHGSVQGMR